jgi:thioredoxin-related protein
MKKFLLLPLLCSLLCVFFSVRAQSPAPVTPLPAKEILSNACNLAAGAHKQVMIIFHASWCVWCRRMDSIMGTPACKDLFSRNYIIRHIDVDESPAKKRLENPGGKALLKQYHGDKQGIPYWLILDKNGKLLADSRIKPKGADPDGDYPNSGCPAEPQEVAYFVRVLKATSSLSGPALTTIGQSFRKK